jgi:hypothetical protein
MKAVGIWSKHTIINISPHVFDLSKTITLADNRPQGEDEHRSNIFLRETCNTTHG